MYIKCSKKLHLINFIYSTKSFVNFFYLPPNGGGVGPNIGNIGAPGGES